MPALQQQNHAEASVAWPWPGKRLIGACDPARLESHQVTGAYVCQSVKL